MPIDCYVYILVVTCLSISIGARGIVTGIKAALCTKEKGKERSQAIMSTVGSAVVAIVGVIGLAYSIIYYPLR